METKYNEIGGIQIVKKNDTKTITEEINDTDEVQAEIYKRTHFWFFEINLNSPNIEKLSRKRIKKISG